VSRGFCKGPVLLVDVAATAEALQWTQERKEDPLGTAGKIEQAKGKIRQKAN
jgi:hypothetical protein